MMKSSITRLKIGLTSNGNTITLFYGLPLELWRIIFSHLRAKHLCRCCQVCKDWRELVNSLDSTRWRQLYLEQKGLRRWKHPNWPNETNSKLEESWKQLYKQRYLLSRLWLKNDINVSCTTRFLYGRRKQRRKILHVGKSKPYGNLRAALQHATPFTKIFIHPGVYQDSSNLCIKFPVEIIGTDDASKIVLIMYIEVRCDSIKLENVTLKPIYPRIRWRRSSTENLRVLSGHLYLFNSTIDNGGVLVVSPGIITMSTCSLNSSFVNLQGIGYSSISCCDFTPTEFAIHIEGPVPQFAVSPPAVPDDVGGWIAAANERKFEKFYRTCMKGGVGRKRQISGSDTISGSDAISQFTSSEVSINEEEMNDLNCKLPAITNTSIPMTKLKDSEIPILDNDVKQLMKLTQGVIIRNVRVWKELGGITVCRMGQAWIENSTFYDLSYAIRCLQNSKCTILNNKIHSCETTGIFMRDYSCGLIAGNQIFANGEAGIDLRSTADPIIQHNEIYNGQRSGIVCLENGKGTIRENDIHNNKESGIYILRDAKPTIKNNLIWCGKAAGIAVIENGLGHITHNVISGNEWAGVDIRLGGNPVVSHNVIENGHSDGIVIAEKGKSVIFDNTITGNNGCGIWILDGSHPLVHSNNVTYSGGNGIAVVSSSDQQHDSQQFKTQFPRDTMRYNNEEIPLYDDGIQIPVPLPELEPESRFIHVSKPDKNVSQIESNCIENNRGSGILYNGEEGIIIAKNKVCENLEHGINLLRSNDITVQNNLIRNNLMSGLCVEVGVCCSITDNGIFDNNEYGIFFGGLGTIKCNDILSHVLPSLFVRSIANVTVLENRLHSWRHQSVYIEGKSRVSLEKNNFFVSSSVSVPDKEICIHPGSDTYYPEESNKVHRVDGPLYLQEDTDNKRVLEDLCEAVQQLHASTMKPKLQPNPNNDASSSAPFFTAAELSRPRTSQKSSFCILL